MGEAGEAAKPTMMRAADLARRWGLDPATVYRMCQDGRVPCRRLGNVVRIPIAEIEAIERGEGCRGQTEAASCGETPAPASGTSAGSRMAGDECALRGAVIAARLRLS